MGGDAHNNSHLALELLELYWLDFTGDGVIEQSRSTLGDGWQLKVQIQLLECSAGGRHEASQRPVGPSYPSRRTAFEVPIEWFDLQTPAAREPIANNHSCP